MSYERNEWGRLYDTETGYLVKEYPQLDDYDDDDDYNLSSFGIYCADDMDENCW